VSVVCPTQIPTFLSVQFWVAFVTDESATLGPTPALEQVLSNVLANSLQPKRLAG
jgi:hypothetical protein